MRFGTANKAYVFFLTSLGAWIGGVIAESPADKIEVSNAQWGQLLVGVVFATIIGYLTRNDPQPVAAPEDNVPNL
jgi:hypothetical protein